MDAKCLALVALGRSLKEEGYRFVAVTPATHGLVLNRPEASTTLRSIFGWNRPFQRDEIATAMFELLSEADALAPDNGRYRSRVRFATIGDMVFAHSAFPTTEPDAVFFGPDTYRFVRLVRDSVADVASDRRLRLVDVGSGSGAGGLYAARCLPGEAEILLADINRKALVFSAVNAAINDVAHARVLHSDILDGLEGEADLIIANPPYLVDEERRLYRHGGGDLGVAVAARITAEGLARLAAGGRLILYTGTPIIAGGDPFFDSVEPFLKLYCSQFRYEEVDPDVFGEELRKPSYAGVDRIAVVSLVARK